METLFWKMGWRAIAELVFCGLAVLAASVLESNDVISGWTAIFIGMVVALGLLLRIAMTRAFTPDGLRKVMGNKLNLPDKSAIQFTEAAVANLEPLQAGWTISSHLRYVGVSPHIPTNIRLRKVPPAGNAALIMRGPDGILHMWRFAAFTPNRKIDSRQQLMTLQDNGALADRPRFRGFS